MATKKQELMQIKPGSPEMEALLSSGYGMSIEEAKLIVKGRDTNPSLYTAEQYRDAKAMIAAYTATPQVISKTPGWKRNMPQEA